MVTEQSLREQYVMLETDVLLEIVAENSGYTEFAVSLAMDELRHRKVSTEEIKNYRSVLRVIDPLVLDNYLSDLSLAMKLVSYFIWFPRLRWWYTKNLSKNGYVLRSDQSRYYSVLGGIFLTCSIIFIWFSYSYLIWPGGFLPVFLFDIYYNKERQIGFLQKKVEEGRGPSDEFS